MKDWLSVGQLAARTGVSRTTLLYYEKCGLLPPSARSEAGYRRYTVADLARAEQIRAYRATGMPLDVIAALLVRGPERNIIQQRLDAISREIGQLREQQALLLALAGRRGARKARIDKAGWTALLRAAGMDDAAMARWHALFEHQAPQAHLDFLRSLGIGEKEIARIRAWSQKMGV